jgi:hypothetical protein
MKRATTLLAIAAMWAATIAAPATANEHVLTDEGLFDWFYESAEADLVLVTGPPFEQGCVGDGFTLASRTSILKDGLYTSTMNVNGTEMRLYEAPSFEVLINAACEAFFTGGDMPEPIAFGIGSWKYKAWDQTELPPSSFEVPPVGAHTTNTSWASMLFTDGTRAQVKGIADYVSTESGPDFRVYGIVINPQR